MGQLLFSAPGGSVTVREQRWKPVAVVSVVGALLASSFAAFAVLHPGDAESVNTVARLSGLAMAAAAAAACLWTAGRSNGNLRLAWRLIAASVAAWAVSQAAVDDVVGGGTRLWASPAAAGFVVAFVFGIAGVFLFWTLPVARSDPPRTLLDGLIVLICLIGSAWVFGLKDLYTSLGRSDFERATQIALPVGEIVVATVLILVINRGGRPHQGPLLIMLASVMVSAIASVIGAHDAARAYRAVEDGGLLAAILLVAIAAVWPVSPMPLPAEGSIDLWHLLLPWMAVGLAAASAFTVFLEGEELDRFLTLLGGTLAALLALSQAFAHRDTLLTLVRSRLSEKTLADVIARAPIGIARADTDLRLVSANPSLGVLLREPPDVIVGSAIVKYLATDFRPQLRQRLLDLATRVADIVESELPLIRADGSRVWVHLTSTAVRKPTGEVDYFLTMLQDTTARHEADEVVRANLAELERLNRLKTEFLQSISHEFRTALMGINGFSELMRDARVIDADEVRQFASDIHAEAERLNRMVTEYLDLDRVETGPARMALGSVDLNAIIRREVEQAKRGTDGITFTVMLDPGLPTLVGDSDRLSQLVRLLLASAVRYSPDGGQIVIASRNHPAEVEVSVRDQGLGVHADFDNPLFSGSDLYANNPIRRVVGTGLGLGIARQIVALHGGRIWIDRRDGIGSEAHVTLPLGMATADAGAQLPAPASAS